MVLKISIYKVILRELVFIALAIFCNHKMFQRNQLLQNWFPPTEDEVLSEYRYAFFDKFNLIYTLPTPKDKPFTRNWNNMARNHHTMPSDDLCKPLLQIWPHMV